MVNIAVIGLGYVGLPLAVELAKEFSLLGFDILDRRVRELREGVDITREVGSEDLKKTTAVFTSQINDIKQCNFYIITVPTPILDSKQPDLRPLISATRAVGEILKKGDIVVYESTVFPGCTEEVCIPILENVSGLQFNKDFFCGYSPERINPGDRTRSVRTIKKVVSGSTEKSLNIIDGVYSSIIDAGTYRASSIKVAEAAKVIENSQRDINIAFINELSLIFSKMNLDTQEVLKAASTKWNFLNFSPGLVGGHCIGVDPYYLTYKAESLGYTPEIILAGRRLNDSMGEYVARQVVKAMLKKKIAIHDTKVMILGLTFKENCPDFRNSKVVDIVNELLDFGCDVEAFDPHARGSEIESGYPATIVSKDEIGDLSKYGAIVVAVGHEEFRLFDWSKIDKTKQVLWDVKGILPHNLVDGRL